MSVRENKTTNYGRRQRGKAGKGSSPLCLCFCPSLPPPFSKNLVVTKCPLVAIHMPRCECDSLNVNFFARQQRYPRFFAFSKINMKSLDHAKGNAQQLCMYESPVKQNLSSPILATMFLLQSPKGASRPAANYLVKVKVVNLYSASSRACARL